MFGIAKKEKPSIIFDFDDTLVYTNQIFDDIKNRFLWEMQNLGFADGHVLQVLNQFDIANVQKYGGFYKECFPFALGQTYEFYCIRQKVLIDEAKKQYFISLGETAYAITPKEVPQAKMVLSFLQKAGYPLFLLSKGDFQVQWARLKQVQMDSYFQVIKIVPQKTTAVFAEFCREQQINPHNAWSIGNSMKADINHALRIGMNGIHVPNPSWDYEEEEAIGDYLVADCLWDCIRFIEHTEKE